MHRYANPAAFGRLSAQILPWTAGASAILLGLGLYFGLFASPPDYQQGNTVRIMYVHVPAAIMSEVVYGLMAAAAAAGIIWKHALADLFVKAAAPLGAAFTFVCLVAGSLWGKPMWGAWWVWDARLTSELVLFFLYLGYLALVDAFDDPQRGLRAGAILVLVGVVDLPIIKFSVDWWNTLHQPASLITMSGPKMDKSMLLPLFLMIGGFTTFFITMVLMRLESELLARRIRAWRTAAGEE
ncbi:MAG TPA: heme ABC transporter permease [Alphaproteobacteria bacterium]|nr:heme ABC transporter permease [Alphaproteobacteria bacterium]